MAIVDQVISAVDHVTAESETPPAERVVSAAPPQGGLKLEKVPLSFSLVLEL